MREGAKSMNEKDFIEKQSILIDRLIEKNKNDNKYDKIKDCFIAFLLTAITIVFIVGYWSSSYDTSNYSNNTISESSNLLNKGGEE